MKTFMKKVLCVFLSAALVLPLAAGAAAQAAFAETSEHGTSDGESAAFTQEDFLVTKGNKIYNKKARRSCFTA